MTVPPPDDIDQQPTPPETPEKAGFDWTPKNIALIAFGGAIGFFGVQYLMG